MSMFLKYLWKISGKVTLYAGVMLVVVPSLANTAQAAGTKKVSSALAFRVPSKKKLTSNKISYCYLKNARWLAATSYSSGKATRPASVNKKDDTQCRKWGAAVAKRGMTLATGGGVSSAALPRAKATGCAIYGYAPDGTRYTLCAPLSAAVVHNLPNGIQIVEPVSKPTVIAGVSCSYGMIPSTGTLGCLSQVSEILIADANSSFTDVLGERAFQADSNNSVYFMGTDSGGNRVLFKMSSAGALTIAYSSEGDSELSLTAFAVLADDAVLLAGKRTNAETGDAAPFVMHLTSAGTRSLLSTDTRTISGQGLSFMKRATAGLPFIALTNNGSTVGAASSARIMKLSEDRASLENYISADSAGPVLGFDTFCATPGSLAPFCDYGGTLITSGHPALEKFFAIARTPSTPGSRVLVQYAPTLQQISLSTISAPRFVGGIGDYVYVSGSSGADYKLIRFNPNTTTETLVLSGVDLAGPMLYATSSRALVGYGTRFSDMSLVFIQIPIGDSGPGATITTAVSLAAGLSGLSLSY